ncbi:hypothetical protein B0H13DRAFT_2356850 [Mycena leptocephala]|nr:hypothetical protein B0H13DRAFT_2356850 [Mycena leptocephala]
MVDLTVNCGSAIPDPTRYSCTVAQTSSLEKINFITEGRMRGVERKWATFFDRLNIDTFPALRQISVPCINGQPPNMTFRKACGSNGRSAF